MGIITVITLYPKRQNMKEMYICIYNLYNYLSYILFSVFLQKNNEKVLKSTSKVSNV